MRETLIKDALQTDSLEVIEHGSGCINTGTAYRTTEGRCVFVKENTKSGSRLMFDGEFAGLKAIQASGVIRCPEPIQVIDVPEGGSAIIMEYLPLDVLRHEAALGESLARMHVHNWTVKDGGEPLVRRFGFDVETCCGFLPQTNKWEDDWVVFYIEKLQLQINRILEEKEDAKIIALWYQLQQKIRALFSSLEVQPSLLHGDLWSGNAGQSGTTPVIFDPACFYGHHEYDLAIASMFGGFSRSFYDTYHILLPKQPGYDKRLELYKLFHYLNHWNHFGEGYRQSSLRIMEKLAL